MTFPSWGFSLAVSGMMMPPAVFWQRYDAGDVRTRYEPLDGRDHFTVLDPLFDPESALLRRIADLAP